MHKPTIAGGGRGVGSGRWRWGQLSFHIGRQVWMDAWPEWVPNEQRLQPALAILGRAAWPRARTRWPPRPSSDAQRASPDWPLSPSVLSTVESTDLVVILPALSARSTTVQGRFCTTALDEQMWDTSEIPYLAPHT